MILCLLYMICEIFWDQNVHVIVKVYDLWNKTVTYLLLPNIVNRHIKNGSIDASFFSLANLMFLFRSNIHFVIPPHVHELYARNNSTHHMMYYKLNVLMNILSNLIQNIWLQQWPMGLFFNNLNK